MAFSCFPQSPPVWSLQAREASSLLPSLHPLQPPLSLLLVTAGKAHRSQACLKTVRSRKRLSLSAASNKLAWVARRSWAGVGARPGRPGQESRREIAHHPGSQPSPREPAAGSLAGRWEDPLPLKPSDASWGSWLLSATHCAPWYSGRGVQSLSYW